MVYIKLYKLQKLKYYLAVIRIKKEFELTIYYYQHKINIGINKNFY